MTYNKLKIPRKNTSNDENSEQQQTAIEREEDQQKQFTDPPTVLEVNEATMALKHGKVPETEEISAEVFKSGGRKIAEHMPNC